MITILGDLWSVLRVEALVTGVKVLVQRLGGCVAVCSRQGVRLGSCRV